MNSTDNDLLYWGLDYPPLTAYHSWLMGYMSVVLLLLFDVICAVRNAVIGAAICAYVLSTCLCATVFLTCSQMMVLQSEPHQRFVGGLARVSSPGIVRSQVVYAFDGDRRRLDGVHSCYVVLRDPHSGDAYSHCGAHCAFVRTGVCVATD